PERRWPTRSIVSRRARSPDSRWVAQNRLSGQTPRSGVTVESHQDCGAQEIGLCDPRRAIDHHAERWTLTLQKRGWLGDLARDPKLAADLSKRQAPARTEGRGRWPPRAIPA